MKRIEGVQTIMIPASLFGGYSMRWSSFLVYGYYQALGTGKHCVTQQEVADFFGMARETVNSINRELVLHGLIKVTKGRMRKGGGREPSTIEILKK